MGGAQSTDVKVLRVRKMLGFKGFDGDMRCLGMQYEVGKTYEIPESTVVLCHVGWHYCQFPADVMKFYANNGKNRFCRVLAEGYIATDSREEKYVCSKITLLNELTADEMAREQPPRVVRAGGSTMYFSGLKHANRPDGSAGTILPDGTEQWVDPEGYPHRDQREGPAEMNQYTGAYTFALHGSPHRLGGLPAMYEPNLFLGRGLLAWRTNGIPDRDERRGPATVLGEFYLYVRRGLITRNPRSGPALYLPNGMEIYAYRGCLVKWRQARSPLPGFDTFGMTEKDMDESLPLPPVVRAAVLQQQRSIIQTSLQPLVRLRSCTKEETETIKNTPQLLISSC